MSKHDQISEFQLEGRFIGFAVADGYKLKLLRLSTASGEFQIKLPKDMRSSLYRALTPGEWVQVSGYQKSNLRKGTSKFKADRVIPVSPRSTDWSPAEVTALVSSAQTNQPEKRKEKASKLAKPATILVCQKSDCCKRGANKIIQALQHELTDRGLADQVNIRGTGCMKQCKAGPNLVMPDKSRYSRIRPNEVPDLIDKHFPTAEEVTS